MKNNLKTLFLNKNFQAYAGCLILLQILMGIFVKVKNGNLDTYLTLFFPITLLLLSIVMIALYTETDGIFVCCCGVLMQIGICMQAIVQADEEGFAKKQIVILVMSVLFAMIVLAMMKLIMERVNINIIVALLVVCTILVYVILLLFGTRIYGAKAWIIVGGFSLQLTEFVKILCVFFMSIIFSSSKINDVEKLIYSVGYLGMNGIFSLLIGEMGSLLIMIIVFVSYCVLFIDSGKLLITLGGILGFSGVAVGGIGYALLNYAKELKEQGALSGILARIYTVLNTIETRILIWLHPEQDPLNTGYQGMKALEAMSLGGMFGSNYRVNIPVEESDYIFVSIILNMGVITAVAVVVLFAIILVLGIRMYLKAEGELETSVIAGSVFYIVFQSFVMIFGSTGFFIMTGVPISFISDGGTATMVVFAFVALVMYMNAKRHFPMVVDEFECHIHLGEKIHMKCGNVKTGKLKKHYDKKEKGVEIDYWD